MIIECHSCHARFRLDESKIRGKGARVKCRRCGNGIIVLRESPLADTPPEAGVEAPDPGSIVRNAQGEPRTASPRVPGAPAPDNLIPFPGVARAPAEFFAAGDDAPLSPRAPGEKDEVDLAFERLLAGAAEPEAPEAVPFPPLEESGLVEEEPLPAPTAVSLTLPEATEPVPCEIPPGGTIGGPALEFGPEETLELPPLPAEASGPEEAAPTFHGEGGFLLSDSETLDFLKEEHRASEARPSADISLSLSATPLDKDAPSLRQPSPVDAPRAAETTDTAVEAAAVEEIPIERNETPAAAVAEVDVPPLRDPPPPAPRIEPRAPASGAPATSRPAVSPALIAGVGLAALLLAGVGYFGFTPSGRETIRSVAPGAAALWGGKPAGEAGYRYDVRNVIGYYEMGADGKRILVIKGQVTNLSTKEKSGIRVVAAILDNAGMQMAEQVVYAGNVVPGETLRKLDRQAAGKFFANRFGSGLANMNVGTGKSVPFMVVFFEAPETIDSYKVEARDGE